MTPKQLDLKTRFRMALAAAGMSQGKWARKVGKVNPMHFSLVLNEKRESQRLLDLVADWTNETLSKVA